MFMTRVADAIGHGRSFKIGVTLYSVAPMLCGIAPDVGTLIALRSLQGLGLAMFLPASFSLGSRAYPPEQRARPNALLAGGIALGFIVGAPAGGWLVDVYGWRAIFLARLPLAILAILFALAAIRRAPLAGTPRPLKYADAGNALLLTAGSFGILFGINQLPVAHGDSPLAWTLFVAGLVLLGLFVRTQRGGGRRPAGQGLDRPDPVLARASLASFVMFAGLPACLFVLPIVMIAGFGLRAWDAGTLLAFAALIAAIVGAYSSRWSTRIGPERLCLVGSACVFLGYLAMILVRSRAPLSPLALPMALIGLGTGLFLSSNNRLLVQGVPPDRRPRVLAMAWTVRQAGYALGLALMASLMTLLQDRLEYIWQGRAGTVISVTEALRFEQAFERGGVWSADVLALVLHVAALLASAIVLIAVVYSIRGTDLRPRNHALVAVASIVFAGLTIPILLGQSGVVGTEWAFASRPFEAPPPVAPFGMASRPRKELSPPPGALGKTGAEVFAGICAACHGKDGRGLPPPQGFKIDLTSSAFVAGTPDAALAEFIRNGRSIDDPRNTTHLPMPPMRGVIPDDRIEMVVQHLRQIRR
jgi:mono/diheme cytochrome c family protein